MPNYSVTNNLYQKDELCPINSNRATFKNNITFTSRPDTFTLNHDNIEGNDLPNDKLTSKPFSYKNITEKVLNCFKPKSPDRLQNGIKAANLKDVFVEDYIDYKDTKEETYVEKLGYATTRIKDSFNPKTLPVINFPSKTMHISNFDSPNGSIAISSSLNKTISTNGLLQCAAVSIVDRENNIQTLLHCCPGEDAERNRSILDYILAHSQDSNPEITIVPGYYKKTDETITFLVDNIRDILGENYNINFANISSDNDYVILKDGKLSCASKTRYLDKSEINSPDKIIFNSPLYDYEDGELKFNFQRT